MPMGLSEQELRRVDELVAVRRTVKRGASLFHNGEKFTSLYAIRTGFFKTTVNTEDGRDQVTGFQMAGEIIGLDGIARFTVAPPVGGVMLYGDYTLQYDATRIGGLYLGTGWYLQGNIPPSAAAFDILNVNVVETPTSLSVSGDLGVSYEVANFLYSTPTDQGANVGSFAFTAQVVPEPSVGVLLLTAALGVAGFSRRRALAK